LVKFAPSTVILAVRLADKSLQKVLLVDLLWEKILPNGWQIRLKSSSEQGRID
jgi:hypothetical protein